MANTRTVAFQVPEELFQRIKEYLNRNHMTQKQFLLGLIEKELDREQTAREAENAGFEDESEIDEYDPDLDEDGAVDDFDEDEYEDESDDEIEGEDEELDPSDFDVEDQDDNDLDEDEGYSMSM